MNRTSHRLLPLLLLLLALATLAIGCKKGEKLTQVTLLAQTGIEDPDILLEVDGDFVSPDRNAFSSKIAFTGLTLSERIVVIGDGAWVKRGGDWQEVGLDDPDLQDSLELSLGHDGFWSDFDLSDFDGIESVREEVNGVVARRISLTGEDLALLARLFDTTEEELRGLEELTLWLAEDGGWPVGMRAAFLADQSFFEDDEEEEEDGPVPDNAPTRLLESFHYAMTFAAKAQDDDDRFRLEFVVALSSINDGSIQVDPPQ